MADIPTPRSYSRILGDQIDVFLSRFGIAKLKVGSPILSLLEAAAMSDARSTQDIFGMLTASTSDTARGIALDRQAADEDIRRLGSVSASGYVTIGDTSFSKVATQVYQGGAAPIVGSQSLLVVDASSMPASGTVYVGRGTPNAEGPIPYSSRTDNGGYWTLSLSSPTQRFHNLGEEVVLGQGGNRSISVGSVVQTTESLSSDPIRFTLTYSAVLPDGEVSVEGVLVSAMTPGSEGSVPAGAISTFATAPFTGASVTNPSAFVNGRDAEPDEDLRERIRRVRRSRSKGTGTAITTALAGVVSEDESRRIASTSIVRRPGLPSILHIDDGTGYEPDDAGVAVEQITDNAIGGERYFQLLDPVAPATIRSSQTAPFTLSAGDVLQVRVGGVVTTHTFEAESFRSISNASAYEVVASINSDTDIGFSARTSAGGTGVVIFGKTRGNEDIQVVPYTLGGDANDAFSFTTAHIQSLRLYKNDRLLTKDGAEASVRSAQHAGWTGLSSGDTLQVAIDGTPTQTITFLDADFAENDTGYSTVGLNSIDAWVKVLNAKVAGATATTETGAVVLTSNLGRSDRASVVIVGGTVVPTMFGIQTVEGRGSDYTLDFERGQLELAVQLEAGDRLAAGSVRARSFVESDDISPVTLASDGTVWVAVDGDAQIIGTSITPSDTFDITLGPTGAWGRRYVITADAGAPFADVRAGDWLIIWDSDPAWDDFRSSWRVCEATSTTVEFESVTGLTTSLNASFVDGGVAIVRYDGQIQPVVVQSGANRTADAFVDDLSDLLVGATAETYRTDRVRIRTNSLGLDGDVAVVTADLEGQKVLLPYGDAVENRESHLGSVESGGSEIGTPVFSPLSVVASTALDDISLSLNPVRAGLMVSGLKNLLINSGDDRWGNHQSLVSPIEVVVNGSPSVVTLRKDALNDWQDQDRVMLSSAFDLSPTDELAVLVDGDETTKRFVIPMWRALRPVGTTYGATNTFKDIGDGTGTPAYLAAAFGIDYSFDDFAMFMRARGKSHSADSTKSILWRWKRFGLEGEAAKVRYTYPTEPDSDLTSRTMTLPTGDEGSVDVQIVLPSGAEKPFTIRNSTRIGYGYNTSPAIPAVTVCLGFSVTLSRTGSTVTAVPTFPSGLYGVTTHGISVGSVIWVQSTNPDFPSGPKTTTAGGINTTTEFYYSEAGDATSGVGTVSFDPNGEATFSGSGIVVGDLLRLGDNVNVPADWRGQTIRITDPGTINGQFIQGYAERTLGTSSTTLTWQQIQDADLVTAFPLDTGSLVASGVVTDVNALGDLCPVTATLLGSGSGVIDRSTRDELLIVPASYQLADGINWVRSTGNPPNQTTDYTLTFKEGVDGGLTTGSDWANEEVRIAPVTASNVVGWLSALGVSGLSNVASVEAVAQGRRVQIATDTAGSDGSVVVQGGGGNAATAAAQGSSSTASTYMSLPFSLEDLDAFVGGSWVSLDNAERLYKSGLITSTTVLNSITSNVFTLSGGSPALYTVEGSDIDITVQVERQGRFVAIVGSGVGTGTAVEGDWLYVRQPTTPVSNSIDPENCGLFRIVRVATDTIWIENDSAVPESVVACDLLYISDGALVPGDTITISTTLWGASSMGTWVVDHVGNPASGLFTDTHIFRVTGPIQNFTGPAPALGTESSKVVVVEGEPSRAIKRIASISPNQESGGSLYDVKLDTAERSSVFGRASGTVMTALDKLDFPIDIARGADGYRRPTGLVRESIRVVYGDENDPTAYPGVIAEGASVEITGPLVRRVQLALVLRSASGYSKAAIAARVRSAVASVVNQAGVGEPPAISDLISAATVVSGVVAVTVTSPIYGVGNDLIPVQPNEKALILDVERDISISFVDE